MLLSLPSPAICIIWWLISFLPFSHMVDCTPRKADLPLQSSPSYLWHPGQHLVYRISAHTLQFWPLSTSQIPPSQRNRPLFKKFHGNWWVELGNMRQSGSSDQPIDKRCLWSFPGGLDGKKESVCNAGDLGSIPGLGRAPGEGRGNPLQYSYLENPHGQRSLVGYSPWDLKESDMTGWLSFHLLSKGKHALKPLAKYVLAWDTFTISRFWNAD